MKRAILLSTIAMFGLFIITLGVSEAQVPKKINYQGYLMDGSGTPVNGAKQMTFTIYDAVSGGTALWSEAQNVAVSEGRYSVSLGAVTPIALTEVKPYWLGVRIGSDPEMTPRKEMTGTIYDVIQDNGSGDADAVWTESEGNIYRELGNVGIGTANPQDKLDVHNSLRISNSNDSQGRLRVDNWDGGNFLIHGLTKHLSFYTSEEGRIRFTDYGGIEKMCIVQSGNVGIGTTSPEDKLHVKSGAEGGIMVDTPNTKMRIYEDRDVPGWIRFRLYEGNGFAFRGTVRAKEIVVTNSGWADFVFADNYPLMPLKEVAQHIKTHGRLPDIPSEKDVLEQGVGVGEMQAKLLQKVEELTLHLIAMEKENSQLKSRISSLESLMQ